MNTTGVVRQAIIDDLPVINGWLKDELRNGKGFIHNWTLIQNACFKGDMIVYEIAGDPIGFLTHGLSRGTILQTKSSCLRQGIGRALVEYAVADEEGKNNAVVVIQCEPKSSVEFWTALDFVPHRDRNFSDAIYMHRLSKKAHRMEGGDGWDMTTVEVYPEAWLYSKNLKPDRVHYVMARFNERTQSLALARRISVANETGLGDQVVVVNWGGLEIYNGKAKRQAALDIGIKPTPNCCGWYFDTLKIDRVD